MCEAIDKQQMGSSFAPPPPPGTQSSVSYGHLGTLEVLSGAFGAPMGPFWAPVWVLFGHLEASGSMINEMGTD
eukprot:5440800-Pyramimonas_sp.AAC.1